MTEQKISYNSHRARQQRKAAARELARERAETEEKGLLWSWSNSTLEKNGDINNFAIETAFNSSLPRPELGLRRFIETELAHKQGEAIGIELGGI